MTKWQYKIKNDRLNKYKKTCNSLNHNTTFCLMANKSKNIILYLFSYFSLSHIFFLFLYVPPSLNLFIQMSCFGHCLLTRVVWTTVIPFLLIIFFFSLLIYLNVPTLSSSSLFVFSFGQLRLGCIVLSLSSLWLVTSRCQALCSVASRAVPPLWRCLSFVASSRYY